MTQARVGQRAWAKRGGEFACFQPGILEVETGWEHVSPRPLFPPCPQVPASPGSVSWPLFSLHHQEFAYRKVEIELQE
eukprot:755961-Hanusia_phi.AAC.12